MATALLVLVGLVIILGFWMISTYNRLIELKNRVLNGWSQIDVQLQRRYDLIPNLVESVKSYMSYEKETLQTVINARNQAQTARENIGVNSTPDDKSLKELAAAETTLKGSLGNIFALAENYPQLRASENMQQLQEELTSTENKVSFSRQGYNDSVMLYNTKQQEFPAVLIAKMFGHNEAALFEVSEKEAKAAPKVNFS